MGVTAVINNSFHALRHRNFRLFWYGQLVSLIGTWMQNVGQAWLVLQLTHSAFKLGVVSALQFTPMLLFSLFAGPFIDRFSKRKILLFTQSMLMILAFTLAFLDYTGLVRYWHIVILATALGVVNTIDMPARQSFMIHLVGKEDLMNAIALNSSIFNAARAVGPAVGGILIGLLGTATCFLINGLSFLAVIAGLSLITNNGIAHVRKEEFKVLQDIKEGLLYIKRTPVVLNTMLMLAVISIFAINFNVLVPVFAEEVLHQKASGFGLLMSGLGIGALIGALTLAAISNRGPNKTFLIGGSVSLSLFLILIGLQRWFWLSTLLLALAGWSMVSFMGMANSTVQLKTEDHFRGRVMSVYSFTFAGLAPIGSIFAGSLAHWLKTPMTFVISGAVSLILIIILRAGLRANKTATS